MYLHDVHAVDPYKGFAADAYDLNLAGWYSDDPLFRTLVKELRPSLVVEVGSWLGASTVELGKALKEEGCAAKLLCVDTWLGAREFWKDHRDGSRYGTLKLHHGYPTVYYQFLANVVKSGLKDTVIPFPTTSTIAARFLEKDLHTYADLVYIDASHDYEDVKLDLELYWKVLRPGGVLFGDDCANKHFPGVAAAFNEFPHGRKSTHANKWVVRKGGAVP